jgi:F0F1-type ATP synthase alpha subunit
LAEPDGINVSRAVREQVRDRLPIIFDDLASRGQEYRAPAHVFRVALGKDLLPGKRRTPKNRCAARA